jgi:hypothetical protein
MRSNFKYGDLGVVSESWLDSRHSEYADPPFDWGSSGIAATPVHAALTGATAGAVASSTDIAAAARPGGGGLLTTYISGDPGVDNSQEFNIQINFSGRWTSQQQAILTWAADFWSHIITGDVRNDTDLNGNFVDDIVIDVSTGRVDGRGNPQAGNILALTEVTAIRDPGSVQEWLPVTASIKLDSTDLKNSVWSGTWDTILVHEMAHALGFIGPIFDALGLTDDNGHFIGANAMAAYGGLVPLEGGGGTLTAGSHWDEDTFQTDGALLPNELMTGSINPAEQTYLSDTTVGALADLGYVVTDPSVGSTLLVDSHLLLV